MSVARKSTQLKSPEEAHLLLKEVEGFIKPEEVQLKIQEKEEKMKTVENDTKLPRNFEDIVNS